MRSFLIAWVVAFGLVAAGAGAVSWYVGKTPPAPPPDVVAQRRPLIEQEVASSSVGPFTETDALQVVSARLPSGPPGEADRQKLQASSNISYHSPGHWRVCMEQACWVAHGQGRYAEPENDLARAREGQSAATP